MQVPVIEGGCGPEGSNGLGIKYFPDPLESAEYTAFSNALGPGGLKLSGIGCRAVRNATSKLSGIGCRAVRNATPQCTEQVSLCGR